MDPIQQELERRIFYLDALNDLGKEIGPLQDMKEICSAALSVTMGTFGVTSGLIVLEDSDWGESNVAAHRGIDERTLPLADSMKLKELSGGEVCQTSTFSTEVGLQGSAL